MTLPHSYFSGEVGSALTDKSPGGVLSKSADEPCVELTIGELIDRLSIENVRLWHLQDTQTSPDDAESARAAREVLQANQRRVALRAEITRRLEGRPDDGRRLYGTPSGGA